MAPNELTLRPEIVDAVSQIAQRSGRSSGELLQESVASFVKENKKRLGVAGNRNLESEVTRAVDHDVIVAALGAGSLPR